MIKQKVLSPFEGKEFQDPDKGDIMRCQQHYSHAAPSEDRKFPS